MRPVNPVIHAFVAHRVLSGVPFRQIREECGVSLGFISKVKKMGMKGLREKLSKPKKKHPGGRPALLSERQRRQLLRQIPPIRRHSNRGFSVNQLSTAAGLKKVVSERTFCRELHRGGYKWATVRKKGVLLEGDFSRRVAFAKEWGKKPAFTCA